MAANWWLLVAGLGGFASAGGHAFSGNRMFYRPMRAALTDRVQQAALSNIWHIITIHFSLSALALLIGGVSRGDSILALAIGGQFASYATLALILSLRLGGIGFLPQWMLFAAVAVLAGLGAVSLPGGLP